MELFRFDDQDKGLLILEDHIIRVTIGDVEEISPGYTYEELKVDGKANTNGGIYTLKPYKHTNTALIMGDVDLEDYVVSGNATFLEYLPSGNLRFKNGIPQRPYYGPQLSLQYRTEKDSFPVRYRQKSHFCWVAGKKGATIVGLSSPIFETCMEIVIPIEDPSLPKPFWKALERLKNLGK
jgi:hypothetical protein